MRRWLATLSESRRRKTLDNPELFATYSVPASESSAVIAAHIQDLFGQLNRISADGMASGEFAAGDPAAAARVVFEAVCALVVAGLRAPS